MLQCDLQSLATDAFGARLNGWGVDTLLSAVGVQQAEVQFRLPRPPAALLSFLSTELVALLDIIGVFEVNRIFL